MENEPLWLFFPLLFSHSVSRFLNYCFLFSSSRTWFNPLARAVDFGRKAFWREFVSTRYAFSVVSGLFFFSPFLLLSLGFYLFFLPEMKDTQCPENLPVVPVSFIYIYLQQALKAYSTSISICALQHVFIYTQDVQVPSLLYCTNAHTHTWHHAHQEGIHQSIISG